MANYNKRVDDYIDKAAAFAQPVLLHIRKLVHEACPLINEAVKWSCPHFDYKGPICSMAAFTQYCSLGFWKGSLIPDMEDIIANNAGIAGQFGKITTVDDLPGDEVLIAFIREAMAINEAGLKVNKVVLPKSALSIPDYFIALLDEHPEAKEQFEKMSTSQKREYVEWFTAAKSEATKQSRLKTAIEQISEGKTRHWKYK